MKMKFINLIKAAPILAFFSLQITGFQLYSQDIPKQIQRQGITYRLADKPLYIDPVFNGSTDPMVCYNRNANKWYMYYTSRRSNIPGLNNIESVHGSAIGIAASDDGGATWQYTGNCIIDYHPDENPTYWAPEVIDYRGTYHMYLSYVPGIFDKWNHPRDLVHLTSEDGVDWTTQSVLKLASNRVIDACIIQLRNGSWRLWYNNEVDNKSIYYADSPDLYNWTDKGKADIVTVGEGPNVIYWHERYYMIVDEWKGLSVFASQDAMNWTKQEKYLVSGIPVNANESDQPADGQKRRVRMVDGSFGNHADIQVSNSHAYMFYFSHMPSLNNMRGAAVYVQELIYKEDGTISCDPAAACYINLNNN